MKKIVLIASLVLLIFLSSCKENNQEDYNDSIEDVPEVDDRICPAVCVPMYGIKEQNVECVRAPCPPVKSCELNECGSGCGPDNIKTFKTLEECQGKLDSENVLLRYNKDLFEKAKEENKIIYLYFYADWCPICKAELPKIKDIFKELDKDVVGFQVNFNDRFTNENDEELAKGFGVSYQHTTIILDKNGNVAYKSLSPVSKEKIEEEINKLL